MSPALRTFLLSIGYVAMCVAVIGESIPLAINGAMLVAVGEWGEKS